MFIYSFIDFQLSLHILMDLTRRPVQGTFTPLWRGFVDICTVRGTGLAAKFTDQDLEKQREKVINIRN